MRSSRLRSAIGLLLAAGVGLAPAACGADGDDDRGKTAGGKVKITVNGLPTTSSARQPNIRSADGLPMAAWCRSSVR